MLKYVAYTICFDFIYIAQQIFYTLRSSNLSA